MLTLCLGLASAPVFAFDVRSEFSKAQDFFEKGQYRKSAEICRKIIDRYPGYEASFFLLGRIFYRNGDHKKAAKYFSEGGISFINAETAFEYGIAMFSVDRLDAAIRAFKEVAPGNENFAYARFYGGVAHAKQRRWEQAERWLRSAKGLPDRFEGLRRQYLIGIRRKKRSERRGQISAPIQTYEQPPPVMYVPEPEEAAPGKPKEEKKLPPLPKPSVGWNIFFTPKLEYYSKSIRGERHGTGEQLAVTSGPFVSFVAKPTYSFFLGKKEGPPSSVSLALEYQLRDQKLTTKKVEYLMVEGGEEDFITAEDVAETKGVRVNFYALRAEPQVALYLNKYFDVKASAYYMEKYPDKKADAKITDFGPRGSVTLSLENFDLSLSGQYANLQQADPKGEEPLATTVLFFTGLADLTLEDLFNVSGSVNYVQNNKDDVNIYVEQLENFGSVLIAEGSVSKSVGNFTLFATGTRTQKQPPGEFVVEGSAKENKGVLKGNYDFPFGISTAVAAEYAQVEEFNKLGLKTNDEINDANAAKSSAAATGTRTGFILDLKVTPIDWAYFSGSYARKTTQYQLQDQEYQNDFISQVPDVVETVIYNFGVTKTF